MDKGYAVFSKKWEQGDKVEIDLPYEIRMIKSHPSITENEDKTALQLGPLVYCAEWADYDNVDLSQLVLPVGTELSFGYRPGVLGGMHVITGDASVLRKGEGPDRGELYPQAFKAIPYYAWAHRGPGQMLVWINNK